MPIIATDTPRFSNLVKHEYEPTTGFCRESVTVNEATAATYAVGTVLGKVTATGKYKVSKAGATDGSEAVAALVLEDKTVAATTDTKVLVMVRGQAIVSKAALIFDATYDAAAKTTAYAVLEGKGILVNETI